jgi:phospholipid transport system substrate-binding protein
MNRLSPICAGWPAFALIAALAVSAVGQRALAAEEDEPLQFIRTSVDEVMEVVYSHDAEKGPLSERLKPLLAKHFDLAGITRRAVGRPWLKFTPQQQEEAVDLFSSMVLRTYADRFEPKSRPTIDFGRALKLADLRWELPSKLTYEGNSYSVSYRLMKGGEGWRVYDMIIEGVSMVGNYREQFASIIRSGGADALLGALRENVEQAGSSS